MGARKNKSKPASVIPSQQPNGEVAPELTKAQLIAAQESFSGPIPPPEIFRQYGEVIPDAPERILRVFELDSEHTREMQMTALKAETSKDERAQWMAFIIMLSSLGLTALAIRYGNAPSGVVTGLATLFLALRVLFVKKNGGSEGTNHSKEPNKTASS